MILQHLMNHEKHYITLNNYLRAYYGEKVYKISLNPGFTKFSNKAALLPSVLFILS